MIREIYANYCCYDIHLAQWCRIRKCTLMWMVNIVVRIYILQDDAGSGKFTLMSVVNIVESIFEVISWKEIRLLNMYLCILSGTLTGWQSVEGHLIYVREHSARPLRHWHDEHSPSVQVSPLCKDPEWFGNYVFKVFYENSSLYFSHPHNIYYMPNMAAGIIPPDVFISWGEFKAQIAL